MSLREHYEQLADREIGGFVTSRVRRAAALDLLRAHGFNVLETAACPAREGERKPWPWPYAPLFLFDEAMTVRPSLGHRLVIAARPRR